MIKLAIYDMDRTITRHGTYTPFLLYAARRLAPWRLVFLPLVPLTMLLYAAKLINRATLKEWNQRLLLGPHLNPAELKRVTHGFAQRTCRTNVYPHAVDRIREDRADGWRAVLATASYRLYVEDIAREVGMDDVIATNSIIGLDARIMARIDGENCYGPAKLRMILAWMAAQGIERENAQIRFYSDHVSDAPVMEWADEPFAVNPHGKLRKLAGERGWHIIDWA